MKTQWRRLEAEMIEQSTTCTEIMKAMLAFQKTVRAVKRDAKNPHFKSKYATLENVMDAAKPVLNDAGIVVQQFPGQISETGLLSVTTKLTHAESGEWVSNTMDIPLQKRDPQGTGSTMTYAMRYSLMAILGLPPTDDDDAESAMDRNQIEVSQQPKSSAQLKKDGVWEKVSADLDSDFADCHTLVALEALKASYRARVKSEGWNGAFTDALKDRFEAHEKQIMAQMEADEASREFINNHPVNAG